MGIAYNSNIVRDGLVLHLDAANPKSYPGTGTTWYDLSGNGNDGSLVNGVEYNSNNLGNLILDGTNDYIINTSVTSESLGITTSQEATLECWMNINIQNRWTGVFGLMISYGNSVDIGWDINPTNNVRIWKNTSGAQLTSFNLNDVSGTWCQFVYTTNNTEGSKFFINGKLMQSYSTHSSITIPYTPGRYFMFGDHWDRPVNGNVSDIQIYNRALTEEEIQQNFEALRGRYGI